MFRKILIGLAAGLTVIVLSWIVLIGGLYAWSGVATVRMQERSEGLNLYLPVPAALVEVAVFASDCALPTDVQLHLDAELGEWGPLLTAVMAALDESADTTLVEVQDGDDWVRVRKQGNKLSVEIEQPDLSLKVTFPSRAARRIVERIVS